MTPSMSEAERDAEYVAARMALVVRRMRHLKDERAERERLRELKRRFEERRQRQ